MEYGKRIELAPGIEARFVDVGHLLGSASIELWITEGSTTTKLVFSGDIGNLNQPIIKDPTYIQQADYVFMESTYGDRNHDPRPDYVAELAKILQRTFDPVSYTHLVCGQKRLCSLHSTFSTPINL